MLRNMQSLSPRRTAVGWEDESLKPPIQTLMSLGNMKRDHILTLAFPSFGGSWAA